MASPQEESDRPAASAPETSRGGFVSIFIRRPILASVLSLLIVIAGFAALLGVEVRELPDVDRPVVTIRTNYPGASPESIDAEVTSVIESGIATIDGVTSISSNSRFQRSNVTVEFSNNVDIDIAATDVQNAVSSIGRDLPDDIDPPTVVKADADASPIIRLSVAAEDTAPEALADLVDDVILPRLQAVEGVAQADDYGSRARVLRVRLLPASLAARGLGVNDVVALLATAGQTAPSGRLRADQQDILIQADAQTTTPEEMRRLRLNATTRLEDVAIVEWGLEDSTRTARINGLPGVGIAILRQAQSNTITVADGVYDAVKDLNEILPAGVEVKVSSDDSIFIRRAIEEVTRSIILASMIVITVIFLFLRSARATMIPAITIPVSLLGTLAALFLAGFSLNLITLLALVMATGLVVDDAIVVTENIERWRGLGAGRRASAILGTREIVFAVLSTTATLAAVFIPISFLPGQAGKLFSEFGFVLAFAVLVSSFVALTLCPMLSVRFGREVEPGATAARRAPSRISRVYRRAVEWLLGAPAIAFGAASLFAVGAVFAYNALPRELTPQEDRGSIFMIVAAQQGANFVFLDDKVRVIEERLETLAGEDAVKDVISINGIGDGSRSFVITKLVDWSARSTPQSAFEGEIRKMVSDIPGVAAFVRRGNSLGIRGAGQGLQFAVAGDDYAQAADAAEEIVAALIESPLFANADVDFETSSPQISIDIDREAAALIGVPIGEVTTAINVMADELRAGEIFVGDDIVEILLSAGGEPINDPTDLQNIFVRTERGDFVPLSSVASVREEAVASQLGREQRRRAVPVTASLAEGVRLGEATTAMREMAEEKLPAGLSIVLLGEAALLQQADDSTLLVFGFAALIVFLVLAAQFESIVSSLIIMVTVPFGLAAAIYAVVATGGSINYYSQIGLVLLIGIMAKNGILIVEFANQLRDRGASLREAILDAASVRLRPVMMTAISTLLGGLPLVLGAGAGAEARAALGWIVVGGLGFATLFTLFLTPVAFYALARFSKPRASEERKLAEELERFQNA